MDESQFDRDLELVILRIANDTQFMDGNIPKVSVIVPTLNRGPFLERCLRAILNQTYRNLECWVMDGNSTDNSLEIIKRLAAEDPRLKYVSEPDGGEVYAINKGLDLATGDIIAFHCSDDFYEPDAVATAVEFLQAHPELSGVSGDARFLNSAGEPLGYGMCSYRGRMTPDRIKRILIMRYEMCPLVHGAFFGWKDKLLRHGKLDPAFMVIPDLEFYMRVIAKGEELRAIEKIMLNYTVHADMGAVKYRQKVVHQLCLLYQTYKLTRLDQALRITVGRVASYIENPHRKPFYKSLAPELRRWFHDLFAFNSRPAEKPSKKLDGSN